MNNEQLIVALVRRLVRQLLIVHCSLFITITPALASENDLSESPEDFTKEVLLAIKYERCEDALNLLLDKERTEDTLSEQHSYLMAEAFTCMGSFQTALDIYSRLLKREKDNPLYLHRRAKLYARLKNWKKAYADCVRLRRLLPREYSYCKMCGEVSLAAEKYADVLNFMRCHTEVATQDVDAQYITALAYQGMKDYNSAILLINSCLSAKPQVGEYHLARAQMYEQTGVLNFAADGYSVYLKQFPTDHKVWLQYALLLQKLERKADMCRAFEQSKANGNLDAGRYLYRFCE